MKNAVQHWKRRSLTLYEQVCGIKTCVLSTLVFTTSSLHVAEVNENIYYVCVCVETQVNRTKRSDYDYKSVGIIMIDIDDGITSMKAWVPHIVNTKGNGHLCFMWTARS